MRPNRVLAILGMLAGCGAESKDVPDLGGGGALPDGFVTEGCTSHAECDDFNLCTDDTCQFASKTCSYLPRRCDAVANACNTGVCDEQDGACKAKPANDAMACTAGSDPGQCLNGLCTPVPRCNRGPLAAPADCLAEDRIKPGTTSGTSGLDRYSCAGATDLTGPEYAYPFKVESDRDVTLTLTGTTMDFDLLVLEGQDCIASAKCVAASLTTGSGAETVTFHAVAGTTYLVVVEGRSGAQGGYTLEISCVGGSCKPIQTLPCNQSVMGDTTGTAATNLTSSYGCNPQAPGPEDVYLIALASDTEFKLKLTGMTTDLDMMITFARDGDCDPTPCLASSLMTGTTDEEVSWLGFSPSIYHVMIDSKVVGQGGPYLLEVACSPAP